MILAQTPSQWRVLLDQPLAGRIGPAPQAVVDYINLVTGKVDGHQCSSATATAGFRADVVRAIGELPLPVRVRLDGKLLGVYFARSLGSSAVSDVVVDTRGEVIGGFVAIDLDVLDACCANQWATWRENTPFGEGTFSVGLTIEASGDDTRCNAIQYLLLHEFGHVLTPGEMFLPDWWRGNAAFRSTDEYRFLAASWQISMAREIIPLLRDDFPLRTQIGYYGDASCSNDIIPVVYCALEKTRFVTLYAATNAYEDFAESFATFVHVVLMKKPFDIAVIEGGAAPVRLENYWSTERARRKREILSSWLLSSL